MEISLILESYLSKYERRVGVKFKKQIIDSSKVNIKHADIIFSMTFKSMVSNLKALNLSNAIVFVFDSPLLLSSNGIEMLDAIVNKDMTKYKFVNFTGDAFEKCLDYTLKLDSNTIFKPANTGSTESYLLYNRGEGESITQMLLTITLLASDEFKKRITVTLVRWLLDKDRCIESLIKSMDDCIEPESMVVLDKFLSSNSGRKVIAVFDDIRNGMNEGEIKSICRAKGVPSFDVLYLLSQINTKRGK